MNRLYLHRMRLQRVHHRAIGYSKFYRVWGVTMGSPDGDWAVRHWSGNAPEREAARLLIASGLSGPVEVYAVPNLFDRTGEKGLPLKMWKRLEDLAACTAAPLVEDLPDLALADPLDGPADPGFPAKDFTLMEVEFKSNTARPPIIDPELAAHYAAYEKQWEDAALAAWKDRAKAERDPEHVLVLKCMIEGDKIRALERAARDKALKAAEEARKAKRAKP